MAQLYCSWTLPCGRLAAAAASCCWLPAGWAGRGSEPPSVPSVPERVGARDMSDALCEGRGSGALDDGAAVAFCGAPVAAGGAPAAPCPCIWLKRRSTSLDSRSSCCFSWRRLSGPGARLGVGRRCRQDADQGESAKKEGSTHGIVPSYRCGLKNAPGGGRRMAAALSQYSDIRAKTRLERVANRQKKAPARAPALYRRGTGRRPDRCRWSPKSVDDRHTAAVLRPGGLVRAE